MRLAHTSKQTDINFHLDNIISIGTADFTYFFVLIAQTMNLMTVTYFIVFFFFNKLSQFLILQSYVKISILVHTIAGW